MKMEKAKRGVGISELFMIIAAVVIATMVFTLVSNLSSKGRDGTKGVIGTYDTEKGKANSLDSTNTTPTTNP